MDKLGEEENQPLLQPMNSCDSLIILCQRDSCFNGLQRSASSCLMCNCHHPFYLRLLGSFLKDDSDWGQFFTISAIQELVTQATPQKPTFCIWSFAYPLEPFICLFNKRLFLHSIILPLKCFEDTGRVCLTRSQHRPEVCSFQPEFSLQDTKSGCVPEGWGRTSYTSAPAALGLWKESPQQHFCWCVLAVL